MSGSLAEVRLALLRFSASFDASVVTTAEASVLLADAAAIERTSAALTVQLSARVAQSGCWRAAGDASPAHQLARQTGLSLGAAAQRLEAGRRLSDQPEVTAAANAGLLSAAQLVAVSDAAASRPQAAPRLVDLAGRRSVGELQEECRRTKAAADRDGQGRRARIHARRSLRYYTDAEGVGQLRLSENPETIAELVAAIGPTRERLFQAARRDGRRERTDALDADALVGFIRDAVAPACPPADGRGGRAGSTRGRATKVLVRVDLGALLRGYPVDGEVCEIAGFGPVAVSAVTDMIATGNPFLAAIATRGRRVTGVAHLGRQPTAAQHSALQWLQPTCVVEGCHRTRRLERDHRNAWADTGITLLEALDHLCEHHHGLKTHRGWALVAGRGKRPMVAPSDPRHPQWQRAASSTGGRAAHGDPRPPPAGLDDPVPDVAG